MKINQNKKLISLLELFGKRSITIIEEVGGIFTLSIKMFYIIFLPPFRIKNILKQMEFIGVQSLFIVILTGLFTGMVFALQSSHAFKLFNAEYLIGPTVVLALTRELSPVLTALMVTGRAGSAMAAELGTMQVTEQIDALHTMAVDPVHYLIVPRVIASICTMPLLTIIFNFVGTTGSYFISVYVVDVNPNVFIDEVLTLVDNDDVLMGLKKAAVFGFLIAIISCYEGFFARGGAKGVGDAATHAVVISSVIIFISDYILTALMF